MSNLTLKSTEISPFFFNLVTQFERTKFSRFEKYDAETGVVILPRLGQAMAILGNGNIGNVAGNVFSIGNIVNFVFYYNMTES